MAAIKAARPDGRQDNELRPLSADVALLAKADGSAKLASGDTSVICGVFGPMPAKTPRQEHAERMTVEITVKPMTGTPSRVDKTLERRLEAVFRQAVLVEAHPRALTTITVQVCGDDGGLASTAVNACSLALMDAGVPLRFFPRACDVALLPNLPEISASTSSAAMASSSSTSTTASPGSRMVLDPTTIEAATALARGTFAFMPADVITTSSTGMVEATASQARAVLMDVTGAVAAPALAEICELAESGATAVGEFLISAITRRTERDAEVRGLELLEAVTV